jgi:hypothetical protein
MGMHCRGSRAPASANGVHAANGIHAGGCTAHDAPRPPFALRAARGKLAETGMLANSGTLAERGMLAERGLRAKRVSPRFGKRVSPGFGKDAHRRPETGRFPHTPGGRSRGPRLKQVPLRAVWSPGRRGPIPAAAPVFLHLRTGQNSPFGRVRAGAFPELFQVRQILRPAGGALHRAQVVEGADLNLGISERGPGDGPSTPNPTNFTRPTKRKAAK